MPDQVYLSCWLRGFTEHNMLATFEKTLRRFPFSRLAPHALLHIYAIDYTGSPVFERRFDEEVNPFEAARLAREFPGADCAYELETFWDLWQYEDDWSLKPSPAVITCYGPLFESGLGEQIRVACGWDSLFIPQPEHSGGLTAIRSNIRSLLHLAEDLGKALPIEKKTLWSDSGENLAALLEQALQPNP
jgi:hypothetical protein